MYVCMYMYIKVCIFIYEDIALRFLLPDVDRAALIPPLRKVLHLLSIYSIVYVCMYVCICIYKYVYLYMTASHCASSCPTSTVPCSYRHSDR